MGGTNQVLCCQWGKAFALQGLRPFPLRLRRYKNGCGHGALCYLAKETWQGGLRILKWGVMLGYLPGSVESQESMNGEEEAGESEQEM